MLRILLLLGFTTFIASCSTLQSDLSGPVPENNAVFPYASFPRDVHVSYDDQEEYAKAKARQKEKRLTFWDAEIRGSYRNGLAQIRKDIFASNMPAGVEVLRISSAAPHVMVRVHNRAAYEWLYAHSRVTRLDSNVTVQANVPPSVNTKNRETR